MEGTDTTDIAIVDLDEPVHVLSQPMNPTDIVQMARELRSLMLPEISSLIKGQLPDIKAAIKTEVTEATNTLTNEIQSSELKTITSVRTLTNSPNDLSRPRATTKLSNSTPAETASEFLVSRKTSTVKTQMESF